MSYEFDFDDVYYDTGHGEKYGDLVVECEPIFETYTFGVHSVDGRMVNHNKGKCLTGVRVLGATLFLVGNNGQEIGEVEFEEDEALHQYKWLRDALMEKLGSEIFNEKIG